MNHPMIAALVAATLAISGCGSEALDDDCSHTMDDVRDDNGPPRDISRASTGDYRAETWFYPGRAFTFTWEEGTWGSCELITSSTTIRSNEGERK